MKTKDRPTQTSDQMAASRVLTRWAPCLLIAKKSTSSATSTNAANKDHMSGEPMDCMTAFDSIATSHGAVRRWVNAVMKSGTQGWSCRADECAVIDRHRDLQRRDGVHCTATVLTTLHRVCVRTLRRIPLATPQQESR